MLYWMERELARHEESQQALFYASTAEMQEKPLDGREAPDVLERLIWPKPYVFDRYDKEMMQPNDTEMNAENLQGI